MVSGFGAKGQVIVTDTIPKSQMFIPTFIRVGTDLLGAFHTAINENRDAWEVQAEIDVYRYLLTTEFGGEVNTFTREDYDYRSDGTYWRFGLDINMIPRDVYGSVLKFGLRYGRSTFNEELAGTVFDPVWGNTEVDDSQENIQARWYELIAGMKARVWKNLYLGYALRVKASLDILNSEKLTIDPYRIPGYGRADQRTSYGVSYYVAWQFQFRQKYAMPRQP